jgi:DNA-binding response OmpR family regulator
MTLKVLVIDDDPTTCHLLEMILQMEDHQTASANSLMSEDILPLLNREKPDLLILDFHLGSQETLKHIATIRNSVEWRQLPILMTSAIDRRKECLAAGASDFILKPFNWQEIIESVNKICSGLLN